MQIKLYYTQIGLRPNAVKGKEVFMKTLKDQFLEKGKVKQGTMIDVTYLTYDNLTIVSRYVLLNETFWSIDNDDYDVESSIIDTDIEDDLEVFTTHHRRANITNILEPTDYKCLYYNPTIVDLTQKEIEKILGYKINIVKE